MIKKELMPEFKKRFNNQINPDLLSLKMVQTEDDVYLEKIYTGKEETPEKEELGSWTQPIYKDANIFKLEEIGSVPKFLPETDIEENSWMFLNECDSYTMLMVFVDIFTERAENEILRNKK